MVIDINAREVYVYLHTFWKVSAVYLREFTAGRRGGAAIISLITNFQEYKVLESNYEGSRVKSIYFIVVR